MGKISNLSSYGFNEQPRFDGFINSLKEKADTTEIAEQVKKQESDIKNINDINTKQDEQILGLNVDIKQSGNAFTFMQGGKNLAVINQENGEGSSVIGGSFSNGKLTLNNSNNTSVEIDASSLAFKGDATSIPNLDAYATKQWVEDKNYLTSHQSLEEYYTKTDSDRKYALKTEIQEVPKFKTVNGQAITGSTDNIEITTDLSNYYKKTETSGATEIRDALANKQDYNENYVTSDQLAGYATTSYVDRELGLKANATDIPTNKIELTFTLTDGSKITKTFYCE